MIAGDQGLFAKRRERVEVPALIVGAPTKDQDPLAVDVQVLIIPPFVIVGLEIKAISREDDSGGQGGFGGK
jgi:hypothetical protein